MLQALLPQVAECGDQVEVWVIDNASPDETPAVVEESRALGPFRSVRNTENIGPVKNVIMGPAELATGEYVWVLGDHNLMMPDALRRVLGILSDNADLDVFYTNFRCATYPNQWPVSATNGFDRAFQYLANESTADRPVAKWHELVRPESALCTQLYAHIVRTQVWRGYWKDKHIGEPYTDATTTYPHTMMLVDTLFHHRSYYIGLPTITIFNGAQSWSNPETTGNVIVNGVPDLLQHYETLGLPSSVILKARVLEAKIARTVFIRLLRANPVLGLRFMSGYPAAMRWNSQALYSVVAAVLHVYFPVIIRLRSSIKQYTIKVCRHVFVNCRIARFLRSA